MDFTVVLKSDNRKTGPVVATYASQSTCPKACPFRGAGCYAESGPMSFVTRRLNKRKRAPFLTIADEAEAIRAIPSGVDRDLRVHVVGDCPTAACAITLGLAMVDFEKRTGRRAWTYSHAWRSVPVRAWRGANVLASCESVEAVKLAQKKGYAAALVVPRGAPLPKGIKAKLCQHTVDGSQCIKCRRCLNVAALKKSKLVTVFEAHGSRAGAAERAIGQA